MKSFALLFFVAFFGFGFSFATDLSSKYGRHSYLLGSNDQDKIKEFVPSDTPKSEYLIEEWKIVLNSGVFYSDETNPDTSKDQLSSVMIYKNDIIVFVAKGYKFFVIKQDDSFILRFYPGVMGCSLIDMKFKDTAIPVITYKSTKDYSKCEEAERFNRLEISDRS